MQDKTKKHLHQKNTLYTVEGIRELQEVLEYHSHLYYNQNTSEISDKEYDELLEKLQKLEESFSDEMKKQGIEKRGNKVGEAVLIESSFKKVQHSRPMISLGNTYDENDLKDFDERVKKNMNVGSADLQILQGEVIDIEYMLEFKFDGLGVELIYEGGKLLQAITRGNGVEGEDVTQNIFQIENIPKKIDYTGNLEVRGEVVMPLSSFERLNKEAKQSGGKIFSNPRNAASGSLRMKDNRVTKQRELQFFAYDVTDVSTEGENGVVSNLDYSYQKLIEYIEELGFSISSYFELSNNIGELVHKIQNFGGIKKKIDFEIDGLVLKVNDRKLWEVIGFTEHHPKFAIAYKFPAEVFTTQILSVEHQVGRTGTITPVANLEGVNMGGAIIRRATLHNYEECEKLGINVGDSVFIKRAGEVIPKITGVATKSTKQAKEIFVGNADLYSLQGGYIVPPTNCPSCGTSIIKDDEKVRYYCPNSEDCFEQQKHKLIYAIGKSGLNIDGFGKAQVEQFLKLGLIYDIYSIFTLGEKREEILELEGFQEKSVDNLLNAIEEKKNISIHTLLIALAISGVGKKTAKELSKLFVSEAVLLHFKFSQEELEDLEDIGPEIAQNMIEFFSLEKNKQLLQKLSAILEIEYYRDNIIQNTDHIFYDKKVCITGSFENHKRPQLVEMLEKVGGKFVSSVSKNTDFLVAGEKAGSKLKKANDLEVTVMDLGMFLEAVK